MYVCKYITDDLLRTTSTHNIRARYGVATISRMLKNIGLFCKRALQKRPVFCKETCIFKHPTNRSHPICVCSCRSSSLPQSSVTVGGLCRGAQKRLAGLTGRSTHGQRQRSMWGHDNRLRKRIGSTDRGGGSLSRQTGPCLYSSASTSHRPADAARSIHVSCQPLRDHTYTFCSLAFSLVSFSV